MEKLVKQIIRTKQDQITKDTPFCGKVTEILKKGDYAAFDLATLDNIHHTTGHYHATFDELYMMLAGSIDLALFDPTSGQKNYVTLNADEVCVIPKGWHHKVLNGSTGNKLLVICVPGFNPGDEEYSKFLET